MNTCLNRAGSFRTKNASEVTQWQKNYMRLGSDSKVTSVLETDTQNDKGHQHKCSSAKKTTIGTLHSTLSKQRH